MRFDGGRRNFGMLLGASLGSVVFFLHGFVPMDAIAAVTLAREHDFELDGDVFVDGAGVGLFLGHAEFREQIQYCSGLDLEFAR